MSTEVELVSTEGEKSPVASESYVFLRYLLLSSVCTPCETAECHCAEHPGLEHILSGEYNNEVVTHEDHVDVVINGHLHHPHDSHYDYHGIYDPAQHKKITSFTKTFRDMMYLYMDIN